MVRFRKAFLVGMAVLLAASCSGDDEPNEEALTATTTAAPITTLGDNVASSSSTDQTTTTSTTSTTVSPPLGFPEYSIISRESSENGDIVVVLLDRTTYESLSDIDVHNVMSDLVEQFAPVYEAHVVETQAAADALFVEEPSESEQTALDNGYVARLEEGFRIVYAGPLEDNGVAILGS
mgnify:CR=1 FL=1